MYFVVVYILTNSRFCPHIPRIRQRIQNRPIPIDRHSNQAENRNRTKHDERGQRQQTTIQIGGQSNGGQNRKWDAQQSDQEICHGQRYDIVVGSFAQPSFSMEYGYDQCIADASDQGDQQFHNGVVVVELIGFDEEAVRLKQTTVRSVLVEHHLH